jgi:hypothetical protein
MQRRKESPQRHREHREEIDKKTGQNRRRSSRRRKCDHRLHRFRDYTDQKKKEEKQEDFALRRIVSKRSCCL